MVLARTAGMSAGRTKQAATPRSGGRPATTEEYIPLSYSWFITQRTRRPTMERRTSSAMLPSTIVGSTPASRNAAMPWAITVEPHSGKSGFRLPIREE
jgi:hypothetical protein